MGTYWCAWRLDQSKAKEIDDLDLSSAEGENLALNIRGSRVEELDLSGNWEVLHYLILGRRNPMNDPLSWAIFGKIQIGPDGDHLYNDTATTKEIAAAISQLDRADLEKRLAPEAIALELFDYDLDSIVCDKEGLMGILKRLQVFYEEASAADMAVWILLD